MVVLYNLKLSNTSQFLKFRKKKCAAYIPIAKARGITPHFDKITSDEAASKLSINLDTVLKFVATSPNVDLNCKIETIIHLFPHFWQK